MAEITETPVEHARDALDRYYRHGITQNAVDVDHDARELVADLGYLIERHARATIPGDDRGRELARALDDLGRLVERIDTGTTTIDVSFATRLARARLDVARYVAAPPETEASTGSLLDAIGNAVYEAGVGRSGPDPTWHGVATAAERAARAWFARRAAPAETEAVVHDPTTEDEDGRCTEYPDLIDRHGARWVWAIGSEYRARHVLGGWKCRDGAYIRRVFGPVTEVPATPPAPEGEAGDVDAGRVPWPFPGPHYDWTEADDAASPPAPGEGQGATEGGDGPGLWWSPSLAAAGGHPHEGVLEADDPGRTAWQFISNRDVMSLVEWPDDAVRLVPAPAGPQAEGAGETDELAHVRVGDDDPTPDDGGCPAREQLWRCTREAGHPGQHIAGDGSQGVRHVWTGVACSSCGTTS